MVTSFSGGVGTPASASYSIFPLVLAATQNGLCPTCKVNTMISFDTQVVNSSGAGELITVQYTFEDVSGATGTCQFTVFPDLTIVIP